MQNIIIGKYFGQYQQSQINIGMSPSWVMMLLNMKQGIYNLVHLDLFNMSVADPRRKSVTIEGLQQNQEYAFSVSALTKEGPGQPASITVRTRTNRECINLRYNRRNSTISINFTIVFSLRILTKSSWILLIDCANCSYSVSSGRLCSLGQDTDSHLVTAGLHHSPVASKKNVRNFLFKLSLKHLFMQKTTWSLTSFFFFVLLLFRLKSWLKGIFAYPAGMNIKTAELASFLHEVWPNHWNSQIMH